MNNINLSKTLVPQKYSKIGLCTSLFILRFAIRLYLYNEKIMSIIALFSYIFTNLHWYKIKKKGIIRDIDIIFASSSAIYGIYRASFYDCRSIFFLYTFINFSFFILNEIMNYFTLYSYNFEKQNENYKNKVYLRSVLIHTICLHILQCENGGRVPIECKLI